MHTQISNPIPQIVRTHLPTVSDLRTALSKTPRYTGARHVMDVCNSLIVALSQTEQKEQQEEIAELIAEASTVLLRLQNADGSISSVNLQSPPDTAFVVQSASYGLRAIATYIETSATLSTAHRNLRHFLHRTRHIMRTGGIHTPNHRWVVCAALAALYHEFQDATLLDRIEEWIGEGIDIDEDGQFCERSSAIYSAVSSECLLETAFLTGNAHLLDPVRRNLESTLYLVDSSGRIETSASRRQDQFRTDMTIAPYYFSYTAMSRIESNPMWREAAGFIESTCTRLLSYSAIRFLSFQDIIETLRDGELESSQDNEGSTLPSRFDRLFLASGLFRRRRENRVTTVFFGADDQPDTALASTASGRSSSPNILSFSNGTSVCGWVRVAPYFFGVGYFRPRLVSRSANRIELVDERSVGYVQPLPRERRHADGIYPLTTLDSRYWSAASLDARRVSETQYVRCSITVELNESGCTISVDTDCSGETPVWFEIAVPPGTAAGRSHADSQGLVLSGVTHDTEVDDNVFIEFSPQNAAEWTPEPRHLGDVDSARIIREVHEHGSRSFPTYTSFDGTDATGQSGLKLIAAPFAAPGNAILTISAAAPAGGRHRLSV
ncbi:MAG: hypothetical protein EA383_13430 [Spirochaetaceae bacterium]|nr:MAG: hypothetical protein EA383_13430 [Spirochaetaceae bacterium]